MALANPVRKWLMVAHVRNGKCTSRLGRATGIIPGDGHCILAELLEIRGSGQWRVRRQQSKHQLMLISSNFSGLLHLPSIQGLIVQLASVWPNCWKDSWPCHNKPSQPTLVKPKYVPLFFLWPSHRLIIIAIGHSINIIRILFIQLGVSQPFEVIGR